MRLHFFSYRNRLQHGLAPSVIKLRVLNRCRSISWSSSFLSSCLIIANIYYRYVKEILESTSPEVEQVTLGPHGDWSSDDGLDYSNNHQSMDTLGGDDLIVIANPSPLTLKREHSFDRRGLDHTPIPVQKPSLPSPRPSGNKRSAAIIIDLTGSDDDDDSQSKTNLFQNESQNSLSCPTSRGSNNHKRIKLTSAVDSMSPSSSINYYSTWSPDNSDSTLVVSWTLLLSILVGQCQHLSVVLIHNFRTSYTETGCLCTDITF